MVYISTGIIAYAGINERTIGEADELWDTIHIHQNEESNIINIDYIIDALTEVADAQETLSPGETRLLEVCKEAKAKGADEISFYGD